MAAFGHMFFVGVVEPEVVPHPAMGIEIMRSTYLLCDSCLSCVNGNQMSIGLSLERDFALFTRAAMSDIPVVA